MNYRATIGMEVHVELATKSKMFCGCAVDFGGEPNSRCCPVCLGFPGSLPVLNKTAIEYMLKAALALNCKINYNNYFHRKNYYYPDLPKNFQTTQYDCPIGYNGYLEINTNGKITIPLKYDDCDKFSDGVAVVHKNNKQGLINKDGKLIINFINATIIDFYNGCGIIEKDNKYILINNKGEYLTKEFKWITDPPNTSCGFEEYAGNYSDVEGLDKSKNRKIIVSE